jgi:hypothetical protein
VWIYVLTLVLENGAVEIAQESYGRLLKLGDTQGKAHETLVFGLLEEEILHEGCEN